MPQEDTQETGDLPCSIAVLTLERNGRTMQTFVSRLTQGFNEREAAIEAEVQCGVPARCDFVIHDRNLDDVFALSRLFPSLISGGMVTRERVLQALSGARSSDRRHDSSP